MTGFIRMLSLLRAFCSNWIKNVIISGVFGPHPVSTQTWRRAGIQRPDMYVVSRQTPNKTAPMFALSFPRWFCKYWQILKPVGLWKSISGRPNSYVLENSYGIRGELHGKAIVTVWCTDWGLYILGQRNFVLTQHGSYEHGLCSQTLNSTSAELLNASVSSSAKHETITGPILTRF